MALTPKKVTTKVKEVKVEVCTCKEAIQDLNDKYDALESFVNQLVESLKVTKTPSINRVEVFNNEAPATVEAYNGIKMTEEDRVNSMRNAIKILPPNMVVNGRHSKENVEAICGFKIEDYQMDAAYEGITHEP